MSDSMDPTWSPVAPCKPTLVEISGLGGTLVSAEPCGSPGIWRLSKTGGSSSAMVPTAQHEAAQIWQKKHIRLIRAPPVGARDLPEFVEILTNSRLSGGLHPALLRELVYQVFGVRSHGECLYLSDNPPLGSLGSGFVWSLASRIVFGVLRSYVGCFRSRFPLRGRRKRIWFSAH